MKKVLLTCVMSLPLIWALPAIAAPEAGANPHAPSMSMEDMSALMDAKIASVKTGLRLTPAQEKNWPAVETAIRENTKARMAHHADRTKGSSGHDVMESLNAHADVFTSRGEQLHKLASAVKPLYESLDDGQKRRFGILLRDAMHAHHGGMWRHGMNEHGGSHMQ